MDIIKIQRTGAWYLTARVGLVMFVFGLVLTCVSIIVGSRFELNLGPAVSFFVGAMLAGYGVLYARTEGQWAYPLRVTYADGHTSIMLAFDPWSG